MIPVGDARDMRSYNSFGTNVRAGEQQSPCRCYSTPGQNKRRADVTACSQALHHTKDAIDAFEKGLAIDGDNAALHAGIMQAIADACAWDKKERFLPKVLSSMQREVQAALQHGARLASLLASSSPLSPTFRVPLPGSFSIALVRRRRVCPSTVRKVRSSGRGVRPEG